METHLARPDGCPLLVENGGNVFREKQAKDILQHSLKTTRNQPKECEPTI